MEKGRLSKEPFSPYFWYIKNGSTIFLNSWALEEKHNISCQAEIIRDQNNNKKVTTD